MKYVSKKKLQLASFSNSTFLNLIEKFDEKIRNRRNCLKTFLLHGEWKFNEKFCFFSIIDTIFSRKH